MSRKALPGNQICDVTREKLKNHQEQQAYYYNRHSESPKKPLAADQAVYMFDSHSHTWQLGTVVKLANEPRSDRGVGT